MTIKQALGITAFFAGLISLGVKGYLGFWLSGFSGLLAGVTVAILLLEISEEYYLPYWAGATLIFGILGIFDESEAFDNKLNNAYTQVVVEMLDHQNECNVVPPKVIEYTILVCAVQRNSNLQNAIVEFEKAIKLSPTQGLISNVVSLSSNGNLDKCAKMFNEVNKMCPNKFVGMPSEDKAILLKQLD